MDPAQFPEKLAFLFQPARYKVVWGGRGGGRSWGFSRALLLKGMHEKLRILCTREIQKSIKDSVHKVLSDQIQILGIGAHYEVLDQTIRGANGTEFIFSGLATHTIESIKSFESIDICWVEEGQTIGAGSWKILTPTIRKERFTERALKLMQERLVKNQQEVRNEIYPMLLERTDQTVKDLISGNVTEEVKKVAIEKSEIWVSFNPSLETDPTYERFVTHPPSDAVVVKMNWRDNPWFNKTMNDERLHDKEHYPKDYPNIWEGECKPAVEGAIYFEEIQAAVRQRRIRNVPYDPMLKAHVVVDLGFNDACAVSVVQKQLSEVRIIHYMEESGKSPAYFSSILKENKWNWGKVWLPFADGFSTPSSGQKSADKIWKALGWDVAKKSDVSNLGVEAGIKVVRLTFGQVYMDEVNCDRLVECMKRYCRNINRQTMEAGSPKHDSWCHGADCVRYICTNIHAMTNDTDNFEFPVGASYQALDQEVGY